MNLGLFNGPKVRIRLIADPGGICLKPDCRDSLDAFDGAWLDGISEVHFEEIWP